MKILSSPKIMMFWDLDTCPPIKGSACEILKGAREMTQPLGDIANIKVYWNSKNEKANSDGYLTAVRTELLLSGISIVDSGLFTGSSKDSITRMLITDVLFTVLDQKASKKTKILIMSTDSGLLYLISLLRSRGFEVYVLFPYEHHLSPEDQVLFEKNATKVFTWAEHFFV